MIKNKSFILTCARYCTVTIASFLLVLGPHFPGSTARAADASPAVLSDKILSAPETLKPFLETSYQQSLDRGIKNYYPYSFALIRECYKALAAGQNDRALLLSEYAVRLSPDLSAAAAAQGQSLWAPNKLLVYHLLAGQLTAIRLQFYELEPVARIISAAAISLIASFFLTLALFCLLLTGKYLPSAYHDLVHILPLSTPHNAALGWGLLIFCAPLLLNCSLLWALCYWLLLIYSYQSKPERRATIVLMLFLPLIPLLMTVSAAMLTAPQAPLAKMLWNANYGSWGERETAYLKSYSAAHPEDTASLFTLGLIAKKEGAYEDAERYYQKVLDRTPQDPAALLNLGNVYCAKKKPDLAVEQYQKVLALRPSSAAAHFNMSRAYLQKFMFNESEAAFMQAKHLDSEAMDYQLATYSENPNRLIIDEPLARTDIWQKAFSPSSENTLLALQLWDFTCRGIPFAYGWAATAVFIICTLLMGRKKRFALARSCPTCGRAFCRRCERVSSQTGSCAQCANIVAIKEGVDPALREVKMLAIKKYRQRQKIITALFTFSFPGAGLLRKGYVCAGLLVTFFFTFFLFYNVMHGFVIPCSWDRILPPARALPLVLLGSVLFCGAVIILFTGRLREPDAAGTSRAAAAKKRTLPHRKALTVKG